MTTTALELGWSIVQNATLPEMIRLAADNGYAAIEVSAPLYQAAIAAGHTDELLREMLAEAGITVGYIDTLSSIFPGALSNPVELGGPEAVLEAAVALGAAGINVMHFQGTGATSTAELTEALAVFCDQAAPLGVRAYIECLPGTGIATLQAGADMARAVGLDRAGVMFDNLHLYRSGGVPADLTPDILEVIAAVQLSDRKKEQDLEPYAPMSVRYLPGDGDLPLVDVARRIIAGRPDLAFGAEVFNPDLKAMPIAEAARLNRERLDDLLEAAAAAA